MAKTSGMVTGPLSEFAPREKGMPDIRTDNTRTMAVSATLSRKKPVCLNHGRAALTSCVVAVAAPVAWRLGVIAVISCRHGPEIEAQDHLGWILPHCPRL